VGVTHLDEAENAEAVLEQVRAELGVPDHVLVTACDPRSKDDVKSVLVQILFAVLDRLETASSAAG
jgi:hypothetical protein